MLIINRGDLRYEKFNTFHKICVIQSEFIIIWNPDLNIARSLFLKTIFIPNSLFYSLNLCKLNNILLSDFIEIQAHKLRYFLCCQEIWRSSKFATGKYHPEFPKFLPHYTHIPPTHSFLFASQGWLVKRRHLHKSINIKSIELFFCMLVIIIYLLNWF